MTKKDYVRIASALRVIGAFGYAPDGTKLLRKSDIVEALVGVLEKDNPALRRGGVSDSLRALRAVVRAEIMEPDSRA